MSDIAIRVEGLSKRYRIGAKQEKYKTLRDTLTEGALRPFRAMKSLTRRNGHSDSSSNSQSAIRNSKSEIWALKDVSFEVKRGEVVGIIGRNGAGKSTLLKILSRITEPTRGYADIHGRVGSLLEVGTGFHPELTGRENIYLNGAILGMKRSEIADKFDEIVAFAEVEKFIDTPVKHYSSGMYLRLAFAVAAYLEPDTLLVDEVLAVGDATFQKKCIGKMNEVAKEGRTILFVSHNMGAIRSLCTKGIFLSDGSVYGGESLSRCIENYYQTIGVFGQDASNSNVEQPAGTMFGLVSLAGVDGNTVHQSEGFEASTVLHVGSGASGFSLYYILEDMHGNTIIHLREESPQLGVANVSSGRYHIQVRLPPLWLNPGLYALHFKVQMWGQFGSARQVSNKFPLDIVGTSSMTESILQPSASWSVDNELRLK